MGAAFLSPLDVRKVATKPRVRWQLLQPLVFRAEEGASPYVVPAGFVTDFASVPRWPLAYLVAGDKAHEAATLHDWLYTKRLVTREAADRLFRSAILAMGHSQLLAAAMHAAVRVGGSSSYGREAP